MRRFRLSCDRFGVRAIRAVATAAVREATNRDAVVERIEQASGIRLEVISGTEEAYLLTRAVETRVDLSQGRSLVVDLGGGSVEVTLIEGGQITLSDSYRLGAIRLLEALTRDVPGDGSTSLLELLDQYVGSLDQRIGERIGGGRIDRFFATGGNIESLAELASRTAPLRSEAGVDALPMKTLAASIQRLARMSFAERVEQLGLSRDRADVILPAAVVYYRLASVARVDRLLVPRVGLRDGLVREMVAGQLVGAIAADRRDTVLAGARALARKYHAELQHAEQVRELAISLFDQTQPLHGLGAEERVLLEAAALLHDIGTFIAASGHHKHSYYLIRSSDIVGLAADERELVGLVARYHRRSHPKRTHPGFEQLTREDRDVVLRLSAILRLADALDREHQAKVARIEVRLGKRGVELTLVPEDPKAGDLALERWAIRRKGALFAEAFGAPVEIVS
jgi:exopolyphosphatase/guanosine-5'-triphosphate,3'-diphosphate pyrophosphatase